jgi:hypothetical protein
LFVVTPPCSKFLIFNLGFTWFIIPHGPVGVVISEKSKSFGFKFVESKSVESKRAAFLRLLIKSGSNPCEKPRMFELIVSLDPPEKLFNVGFEVFCSYCGVDVTTGLTEFLKYLSFCVFIIFNIYIYFKLDVITYYLY